MGLRETVPDRRRRSREGGRRADDEVRLQGQGLHRRRRSHRHRDHDAGGMPRPDRLDGGTHRGAGGESVVDEHHLVPLDRHLRPVPPVCPLAPLELARLRAHHFLDHRRLDIQQVDDFLVEDAAPPRRRWLPWPALPGRGTPACARAAGRGERRVPGPLRRRLARPLSGARGRPAIRGEGAPGPPGPGSSRHSSGPGREDME